MILKHIFSLYVKDYVFVNFVVSRAGRWDVYYRSQLTVSALLTDSLSHNSLCLVEKKLGQCFLITMTVVQYFVPRVACYVPIPNR